MIINEEHINHREEILGYRMDDYESPKRGIDLNLQGLVLGKEGLIDGITLVTLRYQHYRR